MSSLWRKGAVSVDREQLRGWSEYLDPLSYMSVADYQAWWHRAFDAIFQGDLARLFAVLALLMAFYFGALQQRFGLGVFCYLCTILFTYGSMVRVLS